MQVKKCCNDNESDGIVKFDLENLDGLICYCFKHSKKELFESVKNNTEDKIINDIKTKMKDPGCFCQTANPSGKCCMAEVVDFILFAKKQ